MTAFADDNLIVAGVIDMSGRGEETAWREENTR